MYDENSLTEFYLDNLDAAKTNHDEGKHVIIKSLLEGRVDTYLIQGDILGADQYPETMAGFFAGIKIGKNIPTLVDASKMYKEKFYGSREVKDLK